MRSREIDFVLDFLSFVVAVFVCLFLNDLRFFFTPPEVQEKIYRESFTFAIFSFGIFYLFFLNIEYLLSFKFSLPDGSHVFVWLFTIIAGIGLFTHFTDKAPFYNLDDLFLRFFLMTIFALIPAAIFRWSASLAVSCRQRGKNSPVSIEK